MGMGHGTLLSNAMHIPKQNGPRLLTLERSPTKANMCGHFFLSNTSTEKNKNWCEVLISWPILDTLQILEDV